MKYFRLHGFFIILIFAGIYFISCRPDDRNYSGKLTFSKDTVFFDTIFTRIGSTTKQLKVYNKSKENITIKSIYIKNGIESNFRLNIDGFAENEREDVTIISEDSMFILVEVTIDPNNSNSPMLIEDAIIFVLEENVQEVQLRAWGQDMNLYYSPNLSEAVKIEIGRWKNNKPYLIIGNAYIDTGNTLTIEAGVRVHLYNYSSLLVFGTLLVEGTNDEPVIFQGARLDDVFEGYSYKDVPGQWGTIVFIDPSKDNIINYAIIRNASAGFQAGLYDSENAPDITISNTIIDNISGPGIYAFGAKINATNTVISNCGYEAIALYKGGEYSFIHCTIANYWNQFPNFGGRKVPSVVISNYIEIPVDIDENNKIIYDYYEKDLTNAYFGNCIIYGDLRNELLLADTNTIGFEYEFNHCLIKIDDKFDTSNTRFNTIYTEVDSLFLDIMERKYELDTLSSAQNKGSVNIANQVPLDYNGINRLSDGKPDLGAYEFVESVE